VKVIVLQQAEDDLHDIFNWIAKDDPRAATAVAARIKARVNALELDSLSHMGRFGAVEGTLELIEYPYIIIYRVDDERREVRIISIVHGARDRANKID
jgi:plasmid stabilization system protein ParE